MLQVSEMTDFKEENFTFGCATKPLELDEEGNLKRGAEGPSYWTKLWKGAVVPYTFASSFTHTDRLTFARAVEIIEAATCLRFVGRTNQKEYIRIERECPCGGSCFGGGYTDGLAAASPRRLVIGSPCISPTSASGVGLVVHETLHALGVMHTQTRPDR